MLIRFFPNPIVTFVIFLCFIISAVESKSQAVELGGGIGGFNYAGDLVRGYKITDLRPGVFGFYKFNFSDAFSTRLSLTYGKITGSDSNPVDPAAALRDASFSATALEGAITFEYNFLDYKHDKSPIKWSPYFFGGFGMLRVSGIETTDDFNKFQPVLPIGLGIKHLVGKKYSLGLELGARKTFFDLLDGVSDGDLTNKNFQFGNPSDNDWYYFIGISFSYIFYNIPCPFQYVPNGTMMRTKVRSY